MPARILLGAEVNSPATVILTDGELHTIMDFGERSVWMAPFVFCIQMGSGSKKNGRDTKEKYGARIWAERRELWQYLKELVLRS